MRTYVEPSDVRLMEDQARSLRDRLLIRILFHLGCRVSEALAITANDVDVERGMVTILHLKTRSRIFCPHCNSRLAKRHLYCPACGKDVADVTVRKQTHRRQRILPIDVDTLELAKEYFVGNLKDLDCPGARVFPINRHRAWQIVRDCARRAGLPSLVNPDTGRIREVSPHRLRDAFSVHAMKHDSSGDGLRLLQEQLGHASFNTTAKYRKIAGDELRSWYNRLWENPSR